MTHTSTKQPEALRLAEHLEKFHSSSDDIAAASELRYQHDLLIEFAYQLSGSKARIAELEAQLSTIGAGGVEPLRTRHASQTQDAARLLYATKDYDGFVHVGRDKYDFILECMEEAGRSEPTDEDELNGVRRFIDAAISAEIKQGKV